MFAMTSGMKKIVLVAFMLISLGAISSEGQKVLRSINHNAFKPGEKLHFRLHYGILSAGEATLEVLPETKMFGPRECYHVVGTGRTTGAFDWFFKVRDRYESYIDKHAMVPWLFIRSVREGSYKKNQNVSFDHYRDSASPRASLERLRDDLDDEILPLNIKMLGKEKIKTDFGYMNCVKFRPMLAEGRVFKEQEDMTIWVSDDMNRIPVRVQTDILVGSIKMDLVKYENLANELALVK